MIRLQAALRRGRTRKKPLHIWRYLRNFKFNSILIRNFLLMVLLIALPVFGLSMFYNVYARQILQTEISNSNLNSLYRSSDMVETLFKELRSFSYNLSVSADTNKFVYMDRDEIISSGLASNLYETIKFYTMTYEYVDSVYIYSEVNNQILYKNLDSSSEINSLDAIKDKTWLATYKSMGNQSFLIQSRRKNDYYPYYITLICPIKSQSETVGAVVVNVNIEGLGKLIGSNGNVTQKMFILDDAMQLYYSSDYNIMGSQNQAPGYLDFLKKTKGDFSKAVQIDGQETIVSRVKSTDYSLNYVFVSPMAVYEGKTTQMNSVLFQVTLFALLVSLVISYLLTLKSFEPVRSIMDVMENPTPLEGDYISDDRHSNEVKYITNLVRKTRDQNDRLKLELEERLEKLNNAQLRALQNQIDPHFLYNTLDTINWMAIEKMGGQNEVSAMISTLAQLLRKSLQRASFLVTVREEIEHAKLYVKILELRYRDKLSVHWNISEEILDCKTVKLSIQPLVENALSHGLGAKRYQGNIYINGVLMGETAVISVEDDGIGMDENERQELNLHLKTEYQFDDRHVGIRNVNQRFKLLFGDKYGVVISPGSSGTGLAVTIVFPFRADT